MVGSGGHQHHAADNTSASCTFRSGAAPTPTAILSGGQDPGLNFQEIEPIMQA
jgi:hypothetical protein